MNWTIQELDQQLRSYGAASSRRDRKLAVAFWSTVSTAIVLTVLVAIGTIRKETSYPFIAVVLMSFVGLATYIIATASRFHKRYGVFCPNCGTSLVAHDEELELIESDPDSPRLRAIKCHKCGADFLTEPHSTQAVE